MSDFGFGKLNKPNDFDFYVRSGDGRGTQQVWHYKDGKFTFIKDVPYVDTPGVRVVSFTPSGTSTDKDGLSFLDKVRRVLNLDSERLIDPKKGTTTMCYKKANLKDLLGGWKDRFVFGPKPDLDLNFGYKPPLGVNPKTGEVGGINQMPFSREYAYLNSDGKYDIFRENGRVIRQSESPGDAIIIAPNDGSIDDIRARKAWRKYALKTLEDLLPTLKNPKDISRVEMRIANIKAAIAGTSMHNEAGKSIIPEPPFVGPPYIPQDEINFNPKNRIADEIIHRQFLEQEKIDLYEKMGKTNDPLQRTRIRERLIALDREIIYINKMHLENRRDVLLGKLRSASTDVERAYFQDRINKHNAAINKATKDLELLNRVKIGRQGGIPFGDVPPPTPPFVGPPHPGDIDYGGGTGGGRQPIIPRDYLRELRFQLKATEDSIKLIEDIEKKINGAPPKNLEEYKNKFTAIRDRIKAILSQGGQESDMNKLIVDSLRLNDTAKRRTILSRILGLNRLSPGPNKPILPVKPLPPPLPPKPTPPPLPKPPLPTTCVLKVPKVSRLPTFSGYVKNVGGIVRGMAPIIIFNIINHIVVAEYQKQQQEDDYKYFLDEGIPDDIAQAMSIVSAYMAASGHSPTFKLQKDGYIQFYVGTNVEYRKLSYAIKDWLDTCPTIQSKRTKGMSELTEKQKQKIIKLRDQIAETKEKLANLRWWEDDLHYRDWIRTYQRHLNQTRRELGLLRGDEEYQHKESAKFISDCKDYIEKHKQDTKAKFKQDFITAMEASIAVIDRLIIPDIKSWDIKNDPCLLKTNFQKDCLDIFNNKIKEIKQLIADYDKTEVCFNKKMINDFHATIVKKLRDIESECIKDFKSLKKEVDKTNAKLSCLPVGNVQIILGTGNNFYYQGLIAGNGQIPATPLPGLPHSKTPPPLGFANPSIGFKKIVELHSPKLYA